MTKHEIIDKLLITHEVWKCGWSRWQLKALPKTELERWLETLEDD